MSDFALRGFQHGSARFARGDSVAALNNQTIKDLRNRGLVGGLSDLGGTVDEPVKLKGGWYLLPDGTKVRGEDAAREAMGLGEKEKD